MGELKKLEQTTIGERILIGTEICVRGGGVKLWPRVLRKKQYGRCIVVEEVDVGSGSC